MAAPTITQILAGIETRLKTISGLRTNQYVPDQLNPPQAVVDFPNPLTLHEAFAHGKFRLDPNVIILVSKTVDRVGTAALAAYASPTGTNSIHTAIEGDKTLGDVVDDGIVVEFRRLNQQEIDAPMFFGGVFTLHVIASGI
jgi:hypothetical protein